MLGKRLLRKRATLQDIFRLYQVVCRTPKILDILKDLECVTINNALCDPLKDVLSVCVVFTISILTFKFQTIEFSSKKLYFHFFQGTDKV